MLAHIIYSIDITGVGFLTLNTLLVMVVVHIVVVLYFSAYVSAKERVPSARLAQSIWTFCVEPLVTESTFQTYVYVKGEIWLVTLALCQGKDASQNSVGPDREHVGKLGYPT
jgi:hypothetical protein